MHTNHPQTQLAVHPGARPIAKAHLDFEPSATPLSVSVARGATFSGGAQLIKLGCQIVSVITMSRILAPADFGIVAMVAPVLALVGMFQDMGLTQATIQRQKITHEEINSLFWINLFVGVFLAVLLILISPLVAAFYKENSTQPLVAAMSLQVVLMALGAQHSAILSRKMQMGKMAVIESIAAVAGLLAAVAWGLIERNFWALFVGGLVTVTVSVCGLWLVSKWRPSMPNLAPASRSLVSFGAGITGFNFANFFSRNLDQIMIGRNWGNLELGFYDRANRLLLFPLQQLTYPLAKVMIPALSRMLEQPDRYKNAYLRVASLLLIIALPGVAVAIAMAGTVIPLALGSQWNDTIVIFQALGFAGILQPLNSPAGWLFISQGRSMDFMRWGIFGALTTALAFWFGLPYGAVGVATAYAIHEYVRTPLLWLYVGKSGPVRARDVGAAVAPMILGAHASLLALWFLQPLFPSSSLLALMLGTLTSYIVMLGVVALFGTGRASLLEIWRFTKGSLKIPRL